MARIPPMDDRVPTRQLWGDGLPRRGGGLVIQDIRGLHEEQLG